MGAILETERLRLREMTIEDAENIYLLNTTPQIVKYIGEPRLPNVAAAEELIRTVVIPQYVRKVGRWAVILKENSRFIGWAGLKYIPENDEYDLALRYFEDCWRKGYATEAARAILAYAQKLLPRARIVASVHVDNVASRHIGDRMGFRFEGHCQENGETFAIYVSPGDADASTPSRVS